MRVLGIPEYWVVDCVAEGMVVYRAPQAAGYGESTRVTRPAATVALLAFPDVAVVLGEIFA